MTPNEIAKIIFDTCREIHDKLGPGLLESAYEQVLVYELRVRGLRVENQVSQTLTYKALEIPNAYRLDLLVEDKVIVELKAVQNIEPIHLVQLNTYLRLANKRLGLLINFDCNYMGEGVKRVINCAESKLDEE